MDADMGAVSAAPSKAKRCPAATPGPVYPRICLHPRVAWLYDRTVMPCCPCCGPSDRPVSVHPHGLRHLTQGGRPPSRLTNPPAASRPRRLEPGMTVSQPG